MSETISVADAIAQRLKAPKVEGLPTNELNPVRIETAEVFSLKSSELAEVIKKNPEHPCALAYRRAVALTPPDSVLHVNKVDLEALIDDLDVIEDSEQGTTDAEGVTMQAVFKKKRLGGKRDRSKPVAPLGPSTHKSELAPRDKADTIKTSKPQ